MSTFGQQRLVSVERSQTITLEQHVDSILVDFASNLEGNKIFPLLQLIKPFVRKVRCTSLTYRTFDPKGRPVIASGLVAYPENGRYRGTVAIMPYNKEKTACGSRRLYTPEILPAFFGHVTLIPDNIGYGATDSLTVAYQETENSSLVAAHFVDAAKGFFLSREQKELPRNTIIFGYSLGAPNAVSLACYLSEHPEYGMDVRTLMVGSGAYDPGLALENTLKTGQMSYMLYPAYVRSLNAWRDADLDPSQLFKGPLLDDFDLVSASELNARGLAEHYGFDVTGYLHDDFFSGRGNPDIDKLKRELENMAPAGDSGARLPRSVKVIVRHSARDDIVPVECSDNFVEELRKASCRVRYKRDKDGDHYKIGAHCFIDLGMLVL